MPAKVMIVIAARSVTGPAKGVFQFLRKVSPDDVSWILYAFSFNGKLPVRFLEGAQQQNIPVFFLKQQGMSYFSLLRQAIKEVNFHEVSIIQTHGFKPSVLGFFVQLFCRVKWICFLHGTTSENLKVKLYYLIENIVQLFAARTVLVSEAQRDKILCGYDRNRVKILHNAINIDYPVPVSPDRQPVRDLLGLPDDCRLLVVVGRFSPEKGVDVFIDAVARLSQVNNGIRAILVGDGQERKRLKAQADRLDITDNLHFVGFTKTPGDYLVEADIVVVPSRSEGIPNAVLEAMALGKPVVATAVGGIPEIIEDGISGLLVPPERPDLLADAIETVLEDQEMYDRFVVNGKKRMKESFSIKQRVSKLLSIYHQVLDGHP